MTRAWLGAALGCGLALGACDPAVTTPADTEAATDDGGACVPGTTLSCVCPGGGMGAQTCNPDGQSYGACDCGEATTGVSMSDGADAVDTAPDGDATATGASMTDAGETDAGETDAGETDEGTTAGETDAGSTDGGSTDESTGGGSGLDGWTLRRPVTIDNELGAALTDCQVRVVVDYDEDMQSDFADLRFTEADDDTILPHWIAAATPPIDAEVWVRVPSVPAGGELDLWMYYGNGDAPDGSDGEATMYFIDDFESGVLDGTKWTETSGSATLINGRIELGAGALVSDAPVVEPGQLMQARVRWPDQIGDWDQFGRVATRLSQGTAANDQMSLSYAEFGVTYNVGITSGPAMNTTLVGLINSSVWYDVGLAREAGQIHYRLLGPATNGVSFFQTLAGDHYIVLGDISGTATDNGTMPPQWVEHVFVRCYADLDPTAVVGDEVAAP